MNLSSKFILCIMISALVACNAPSHQINPVQMPVRETKKPDPPPKQKHSPTVQHTHIQKQPLDGQHGQNSYLVRTEGFACMGQKNSRDDTRALALANAKKNAVQNVVSKISSETLVVNGELKSDVVNAYANGQLTVLETQGKWVRESSAGHTDECYQVSISAELIPDYQTVPDPRPQLMNEPRAPLTVSLWTDKSSYLRGEFLSVHIKGNKGFYGMLIYTMADGTQFQILPNPFRKDNYFEGGRVYTLPGASDQYQMMVSEPVGEESIRLYASETQLPLNQIQSKSRGPLSQVYDTRETMDRRMRGVVLISNQPATDFVQAQVNLTTY
jgi:hypothetical protein